MNHPDEPIDHEQALERKVIATCRSDVRVIFALYGAVTAAFAVVSLTTSGPILDRLMWMMVGFCTWNVVEYVIHRGFFHLDVPAAPWNYLTYGLHIYHHGRPEENDYTPVPLKFTVPLMFMLICFFYLIGTDMLAFSSASTALGLCYLYFEWIHKRIHAPGRKSGWVALMSRYHLHHHFKSASENFGLTFPFVDMLVGTAKLKSFKSN